MRVLAVGEVEELLILKHPVLREGLVAKPEPARDRGVVGGGVGEGVLTGRTGVPAATPTAPAVRENLPTVCSFVRDPRSIGIREGRPKPERERPAAAGAGKPRGVTASF